MMRARLAWVLGVLALGCASGGDNNTVVDPDSGVVPTDLGGKKDVVDVPAVIDAPDVVDASDAGPPCRTTDDCVAPDLCTNAQVCRFGRCVVTGGAATCDDQVACTDDRCDATAGRCVHAPNDMRCPSGRFCVPNDVSAASGGCVAELPCELGDSTCARLQGDPCSGTWSCDPARLRCVRSAPFNCDDMDTCTMDLCMTMGTAPMCSHMGPSYQTDAMNCGACGRACMAGANQVAACVMGTCQNTCAMGWRDLDGMPGNGCECNTSMADAPDLMFRDTNCDGIDGDAASAVFVSPRGNDANPGTREMPKRTITAAITAANEARPVRAVYAAQGVYAGPMTITSGVSLYGGYDDQNGWSRDRANTTSIESDSNIALTIQGVTTEMEIQLFTITSAAGANPGESSYGVRLLNNSGRVTLRGCSVAAGAGVNGDPGQSAAQGAQGGNGGSASGRTGGAAGVSTCGVGGGGGGTGGSGPSSNGTNGGTGSSVTGGGTAGNGGMPSSGTGCDTSSCASAANPATVGAGGNGPNGSVGSPGPSRGTLNASGVYVLPVGGSGAAGGPGGGGGGGGGRGGPGTRTRCDFTGSCRSRPGGGGGGGGAGGCGGGGGLAGMSGGASIAVVSIASTLSIESTQLHAGRGGRGGNGGNGAIGGSGGSGGSGAAGECCNGPGAPGQSGGGGGNGAGGAGGSGGPSFCVWFQGTPPAVDQSTTRCVRGGAGSGGNGGSMPGGTAAPAGPLGVTEDYHAGG